MKKRSISGRVKGREPSRPKIAIWPEYQDEISSAFDSIVLMHKTPKEALDDVVNHLQPELDDYNERLLLRGEK